MNRVTPNQPFFQSKRATCSFTCANIPPYHGRSRARDWVTNNAKAAQRASSLSSRHALNQTVLGGFPFAIWCFETSFESWSMNEDLPQPQGPSTETVKGGLV